MSLYTIKTFDNAIDAHHFKNRLEIEDIEAYIFDENVVSLNPLYSNAIGGIKVKIREEDMDSALRVIQEIDNNSYDITPEEEKLTCPNCNATTIDTKVRDFKNTGGILSLLFSFLFFVYPIYYRNSCKCQACGLEFTKD